MARLRTDRISISFKCCCCHLARDRATSRVSNWPTDGLVSGERHYFNRFKLAPSRALRPPPLERPKKWSRWPAGRGAHYWRASALLLVVLLLVACLRSAQAAGQSKQFVHLRTSAHPDAPKLIPLSALDRYPEGADLRLFCSAAAPAHAGRLSFEWRRDEAVEPLQADPATSQRPQRIQISSMEAEGASLLRISRLEPADSGNYTCWARNQHGADSSTVRVQVNVGLKWTLEPPSELQVRAGKFVQLECDATGQPAPLISWTSIKDHRMIDSKVLRIERANANHSGLYECRAQAASEGAEREQLRKIVRLTVNGKCASKRPI